MKNEEVNKLNHSGKGIIDYTVCV